ncbi:hypothetical protein IDZ49_11680, partial [Francisella tularensis]|nr:hypothetical protein [Francisella tularensis]
MIRVRDNVGMHTQEKLNGFIVGFAGVVNPAKGKMLAPILESVIFEDVKLYVSVFILVLR